MPFTAVPAYLFGEGGKKGGLGLPTASGPEDQSLLPMSSSPALDNGSFTRVPPLLPVPWLPGLGVGGDACLVRSEWAGSLSGLHEG